MNNLNGTWYVHPYPYKRELNITLKAAKIIAKNILGRLPKCGREVPILSNDRYTLYLMNISGTYEIRQYWKQN